MPYPVAATRCRGFGGGDATPTVLVLDYFTAADSTSLHAHAPDINIPGNAWVELLTTDADIQIQSNRARGMHTGVPSYPSAVALIETSESDVLVTGTITNGTVASTSSVSGLIVRGVDINNYWAIYIDDNNDTFFMVERQGGSNTTRASTAVTLDVNTSYIIRVLCSGNTITATLDGANQIQYTSATFQNTATKHGFFLRRVSDTCDSWSCSTGGNLTQPISNIVKSTFTAVANDWNGRASVEVVNGVVVLVYQSSSAHAENDGNLHIRFSDDYGETWTAEDTKIGGGTPSGFPMEPPDAGAGEDAGEPWLYIAPNGDLLLHMWRVNYGTTSNGTYQSRSTDGGLTWSTPAAINFTGIADDTQVFATDDHFVYSGVIYACARVYDDEAGTNSKSIFIKSADNGTTWEYVSDISSFATPTEEVGIEYLGSNNIIALLRDDGNAKTYKATSSDMGATWSALTDISDVFQASGRHRIFTRTHLEGGANWWTDNTLIVCGFELPTLGFSNRRRNAIWLSRNGGTTWEGPYWVDLPTSDAGYGDMFYDPENNKYVFISYQGSLNTADLVQYKFSLDM